MTITQMSALSTFREALLELENAADALDQAHSSLKQLGLHKYRKGSYGRSIELLSDDAFELLKYLRQVECEECGKAMGENENCLNGSCYNPENYDG
jgi:cellobiose-specific phosphotransferase system component IIA